MPNNKANIASIKKTGKKEVDYDEMQRQRRHKSDTDKAVGYNVIILVLAWAFASIFLILALAIVVVFFVYLYYIVNPNVGSPPMKIGDFLSITWDVISAGTVATMLSVFLPKIIAHISSSGNK